MLAIAVSPQRQLQRFSNGADIVGQAAVAVQEETPEPELFEKLAPLGHIEIRPLRQKLPEPHNLIPSAIPAAPASPALGPPTITGVSAQFGFELAPPAPPSEISFEPARPVPYQAADVLGEPLPSRRQSVAFMRPESAGAHANGLPLARPAYDKLEPPPSREGNRNQPLDIPASHDYPQNTPEFVPSPLQLAGDSFADLLNLLKSTAEERERAGIGAIAASFRERPAFLLLPTPLEIITAPAPPCWQWKRSARLMFTPIPPGVTPPTNGFVGPQAPTLAGPSLPAQLLNFSPQNSRLELNRKRPTWPISLIIATLMILGAVSVLQYITQNRDDGQGSEVAPVRVTKSVSAPAVPSSAIQEHPAARSVEVAGIRIVTGSDHRPQLRYIVINHASKEVKGLNIRIAVRSVDGLSGPPLFTVSSNVASLGADESREVRTTLSSSIPSSSIPDWQSLRTEVVIARQ